MSQVETADVIIIGNGIIGLSTALEVALAGGRGHVLGVSRDGSASTAAAGLLAPSLGQLDPLVEEFFFASVNRYPSFAGRLSAFDPRVHLVPWLLDVRSDAATAPIPRYSNRLSAEQAVSHQPGIVAPTGGLLHYRDFAIDNVRLMAALCAAVVERPGMTVTSDDAVTKLTFESGDVTVRTASGRVIVGRVAVLAAGAWSPQIEGLPRPLPVRPLKGQMLAVDCRSLHHPVAGDDVYLVPRHDETLVGATVEHAGFDTSVDEHAIERIRRAAVAMYPPLATARVTRTWAGIRPATPDMLPIIGRDPAVPSLIYACGHSKNGILLAPETARVVSRLALDLPVERDLGPFRIDRFDVSVPQ